MNARQRRLVEALRAHPLEPPGVRLRRPERADVEAIASERDRERRVVDLRIVGEQADRGVAVGRLRLRAARPAIAR